MDPFSHYLLSFDPSDNHGFLNLPVKITIVLEGGLIQEQRRGEDNTLQNEVRRKNKEQQLTSKTKTKYR